MVNTKRKHRSPRQTSQPVAFWLHGLAAMGDERWEEAISAFQRFANLTTDKKMAYFNLSTCYEALERHDDTLEMLDKIEQHDPENPEAVHSRAITYACMGRIQDAITTFKAFRRRWPRQARQSEIRNDLRKLQRISRGELPPGDYLVDYLQEQISLNVEMGDYHLAERKAQRMIAANPDRPEGHFALGLACLEQDRYEEALDALLMAHDCNPDHISTLYNIGYTYLKLDKPEQALSWLEQTQERDSQHLAALYQLGVACERLGRREGALAWWRRALEIKPDYYLAQQRLHEIDEGPKPKEPPLPPQVQQMKRLTPLIKAQMRRPRVYRNGAVTLTYDRIGFVLEDTENPHNATLYSGGPFFLSKVPHKDKEHLLDMIGMVKMLLHLINAENTRRVAVLVYYPDRPIFSYQARFERDELVDFDAHGQFVVTEVPRFFKMNIDSDLSTPYGDPMQGMLIYLNQTQKPGILINTLKQPSP
jgi:tetratricopeptide (TPR) repeat protein